MVRTFPPGAIWKDTNIEKHIHFNDLSHFVTIWEENGWEISAWVHLEKKNGRNIKCTDGEGKVQGWVRWVAMAAAALAEAASFPARRLDSMEFEMAVMAKHL